MKQIRDLNFLSFWLSLGNQLFGSKTHVNSICFKKNVCFLMKVKKSKNSDLWSASSEVNQILAIQLFCKFWPLEFFFIPFWAFWNFSYLLRPTLNEFYFKRGRCKIWLKHVSCTLFALVLYTLFTLGVTLQKI